MRWSTYLHPDSIFLAQDEEVMVYGTPSGFAVLEFSGEDVTVTTYPDAVAFGHAINVNHPELVKRTLAMSILSAAGHRQLPTG